jgi:hypothetical protein
MLKLTPELDSAGGKKQKKKGLRVTFKHRVIKAFEIC